MFTQEFLTHALDYAVNVYDYGGTRGAFRFTNPLGTPVTVQAQDITVLNGEVNIDADITLPVTTTGTMDIIELQLNIGAGWQSLFTQENINETYTNTGVFVVKTGTSWWLT